MFTNEDIEDASYPISIEDFKEREEWIARESYKKGRADGMILSFLCGILALFIYYVTGG